MCSADQNTLQSCASGLAAPSGLDLFIRSAVIQTGRLLSLVIILLLSGFQLYWPQLRCWSYLCILGPTCERSEAVVVRCLSKCEVHGQRMLCSASVTEMHRSQPSGKPPCAGVVASTVLLRRCPCQWIPSRTCISSLSKATLKRNPSCRCLTSITTPPRTCRCPWSLLGPARSSPCASTHWWRSCGRALRSGRHALSFGKVRQFCLVPHQVSASVAWLLRSVRSALSSAECMCAKAGPCLRCSASAAADGLHRSCDLLIDVKCSLQHADSLINNMVLCSM